MGEQKGLICSTGCLASSFVFRFPVGIRLQINCKYIESCRFFDAQLNVCRGLKFVCFRMNPGSMLLLHNDRVNLRPSLLRLLRQRLCTMRILSSHSRYDILCATHFCFFHTKYTATQIMDTAICLAIRQICWNDRVKNISAALWENLQVIRSGKTISIPWGERKMRLRSEDWMVLDPVRQKNCRSECGRLQSRKRL